MKLVVFNILLLFNLKSIFYSILCGYFIEKNICIYSKNGVLGDKYRFA